ncbi:methionyl-tRNA formyltransferase [Carnobacterium sp. ISL-102]|uniref:methionyl-tRNA formyltransferase n=1 Tax=Carnobacterium sp. ISL-102 TaxID=2819142 RepID=UPI001BEA732F|nr:methionyl-tRNA formyltransferase [Carnobacterium sp. ISL-102]MBT2731584.1 methionyl-tRNA formyltransferase [Carnobacterium sp. ISL-102]
MIKIIFMGTPAFSVPILEALIDSEYQVVAVVTQPDRPVGRKKVLQASPVKAAALEYGLPIFQPEKISGSSEMDALIALEPDLIVTAAFGQFLPQKLLSVPKYGAINVHASLLPKYRGGAPVHYALMKGEKETGVSIMYMEKKMDAGDIIAQKSLEISRDDDVGTLFDRLSALGKDLLMETLPKLLAEDITPVKQNEAEVTFSPNIKREEEEVDWTKTAAEVDYQVRGMRPWPVAYTVAEGKRLKLWDVTPIEEKTTASPGTIIRIEKEALYLACGNQTVVKINEVQPAGRSKMTIMAFLTGVGSQLKVGEKVGSNGK